MEGPFRTSVPLPHSIRYFVPGTYYAPVATTALMFQRADVVVVGTALWCGVRHTTENGRRCFERKTRKIKVDL